MPYLLILIMVSGLHGANTMLPLQNVYVDRAACESAGRLFTDAGHLRQFYCLQLPPMVTVTNPPSVTVTIPAEPPSDMSGAPHEHHHH